MQFFDVTEDTTEQFSSVGFMFLFFWLPVLIAIFFHAGFLNPVTASQYLLRVRPVWALRRFRGPAGKGLLGNIWPTEHLLLGSNMLHFLTYTWYECNLKNKIVIKKILIQK